MARPKQSVELLLLKGRKHLTKTEIEERKSSQIKAPADKVRAPSYLSDDLKKDFKKLSKQLIDLEIFSNLDVDTLARYLIAQDLYLKFTKKITSEEFVFDEKIIAAQDKYFKQCRQCALDLGLTISSRCKLAIPKQEEKEADPRDKRFGDV